MYQAHNTLKMLIVQAVRIESPFNSLTIFLVMKHVIDLEIH